MKKEQILVLVAVGAAGVIVATNLGLYEDVGAREIGDGKQVGTSVNVQYDPQTGLPADFGDGRILLRERRTEERPPLPSIESPTPLPPTYVRLLPWPSPNAPFWGSLRERYPVVARPADVEETAAADEADEADDAVDIEDPLAKKPVRDMAKVARIVMNDGVERPVVIVPQGDHKGKPLWELLRDWPNVQFLLQELNDDGTIKGSYVVKAADIAGTGISTFHLPLNCENEYWEERIRRRIAADDRGSLMEFARWVVDTLVDKYGIEARRLAVKTMEEAAAIKVDLAIVRELSELYRAAYNPEGELRVIEDFVKAGNGSNPAALELQGEAYERAGALGLAAQSYEKAATAGSTGARLGLARVRLRMQMDAAALDEFRTVQTAGSVEQQAASHAGEARIHIEAGRFQEALASAQRGAQVLSTDAGVQNVLGAALYYLGRASEAEAAFRKAAALAPKGDSRARSNLGMALVALGRLDDAKAEFQACLDTDPLNFVDPLAGLGDVLQRQGYLTEANDYFETARVRSPQNPWVLLRLGTAKLRDGVAERALVVGREIVAAAPGSVDGLQLAGLAAGAEAAGLAQQSAEAADEAERAQLDETRAALSEEALRHLERAISKEPENAALLRQYVLALLQAGRAKDSLAVLEKATAVGSGFARRDGRTLLLLAYVLFINRAEIDRVREAIDNALRTEMDDAAKAYARMMRDKINEWDALRIWGEPFRRNGTKVLNGWVEDDERLNVTINAAGQYVNFVGTTKAAAEGRAATSLERGEDAKKIREWEASFKVLSLDTEFVMHVYKGALQTLDDDGGRRGGRSGGELAFVVSRDGKMQIWSTSGSRGKAKLVALPIQDAEGNDLMWPRDDAFHAVRMVRTNHEEGTWQVYLDGEPVGEPQTIQQLQAARNTEVRLGFSADAERGTKVEVHIDRVQITRTVD